MMCIANLERSALRKHPKMETVKQDEQYNSSSARVSLVKIGAVDTYVCPPAHPPDGTERRKRRLTFPEITIRHSHRRLTV